MKKSNRELALEYLAKAQKDDEEKIKAFKDACFTDGVLNDLASFTKTDFKKAGASLGKQLKNYFESMKQSEDAEKQKKASAKTTQTTATQPVQNADA